MSLGLSAFTEFGPCEHLASLQMFHRRLYILSWMVNVLSFPLPPPQRGSGISDESSSLTQTADESLRTIWFTASLELTSISLSPPSLLLSFLSYALCFAHYSHSDSWIQIMSRIVYTVWVFLASIQRLALDSFLFFFSCLVRTLCRWKNSHWPWILHLHLAVLSLSAKIKAISNSFQLLV